MYPRRVIVGRGDELPNAEELSAADGLMALTAGRSESGLAPPGPRRGIGFVANAPPDCVPCIMPSAAASAATEEIGGAG